MVLVPVQPNLVSDTVAVGVEQGAKYALIGPDGTRVVWNDRTDPDFVGFLTSPPSGLDSAEVRESSDLLVEADGGIHGAFYFGRRPFGLDGIIDPTPGALDFTEELTLIAQNLVANPSAETNTTGWTAATTAGATTPAALALVADTFGEGANAFRVTGTNAADTTQRDFTAQTASGTAGIPILGTTPYTLGVDVRTVDAAALGVGLLVEFYDAAGVSVGLEASPLALAGTVGTSILTMIATSPATAAYARVAVYARTSTASDAIDFRFDLVTFVQGETARRFTGATNPTGSETRTAWAGTAHASQSTLSSVARIPLGPAATTNRRVNRLQRASRALRGDSRLEWTPQTAPPVRVTGRRAAALRVTNRLPKLFSLSMVSADHRIFGQAVRTISAALGTGASAQSDGNSPTPPTVTIRATGAVASPIAISSAGSAVNLTLALVANDVLVVDFAAKTVTLNGTNRYDALVFATSTFWDVIPGTNPVTVTGGSTAGSWELTYRDAWA